MDYELLDFGDGRKLERFGHWVLDRPSPPARGRPAQPEMWSSADGRYGGDGHWTWRNQPAERWTARWDELVLELKPTPFGHLGVFPEQAANWRWLAALGRSGALAGRALNLFAYTGGSTLAAARWAEVAHVDSAANVVRWARRNGELSDMREAPVRWICEDAAKFVARELKRGAVYDHLILDPPSFGRGPKGQQWKVERDLSALFPRLAELSQGEARSVLFTCHSPNIPLSDAERWVRACCRPEARVHAGPLRIDCRARPEGLPAGFVVRAHSGSETRLD